MARLTFHMPYLVQKVINFQNLPETPGTNGDVSSGHFFLCDVCQERFKQKSDVTAHMETHKVCVLLGVTVADLGGGASAARAPPFPRALKQVLVCQNRTSGSKVTGFQSSALKYHQNSVFYSYFPKT